MQVDLLGANVELRAYKLTKGLLKQAKALRSMPKEFCKEGTHHPDPKVCIGYVHGSILGDEHTLYLVFVHDGQLYTLNYPSVSAERDFPGIKQLYV